MEYSNKYKWHFLGSMIAVSIIAIIGFVSLSHSYYNRLETIEELQKRDGKRIEIILNNAHVNKKNIVPEVESLTTVFSEHSERMEGLLNMEFEKLQNDFNFISLWAGLLTIVFLIFSIYSIFKTDEMLKKSENVYDEIKDKAYVVDNFTKNVKRKYKQELNALKKDSDDYIKDLLQKISLLVSRMASTDSLVKQVKNSTQVDDSVHDSSEEHTTQELKEDL